MQISEISTLAGLPLKKIGILITRISLGTPIGLVYVELRRRENDELAVEMYTPKGQSIDPLKLIGSPPPAFWSRSPNISTVAITIDPISVNYNFTIQEVCNWINKSNLCVLGNELSGLDRESLVEIESKYLMDLKVKDIANDIHKDIVSGDDDRSLWISREVIDSWSVDEDLVYKILEGSAVVQAGPSGVRITCKPFLQTPYWPDS